MNILETVLKFDNHWKHPEADFTVSQIAGNSKQQLYLHSINTPKTHEIALEDRVSAQIGTGFHMRAEEALKDTSVITEHKMFCEIEGVKISGTADVIYDNGLEDIVGDFKTMGWFQIKKLMRGETSKFVEQLSLYAYMYSKETKSPMATKGEIYVLRTGDNGFIGKNEKEYFPYGIPRYITYEVPLMTKEEVHMLVKERTQHLQEIDDCDSWRCQWCEYECKFRKEKK